MIARRAQKIDWPISWMGFSIVTAACTLALIPTGCKKTDAPSTQSAGKPAARPNIIMILVDTLRADRLGCYGDPRNLTPAMDQIANSGTTFAHCVTQSSWTQPAIASLFTSRYPSVHGVNAWRRLDRKTHDPEIAKLRDGLPTLAESLKDAGYATAAIVTNAYVRGKYGFDQGFDHFQEILREPYPQAPELSFAAETWIKQRPADKPFFLYLHYMDVHGPYEPPEALLLPMLDEIDKQPPAPPMGIEGLNNLSYLMSMPKDYSDPDRHMEFVYDSRYWIARYDAGVKHFDNNLADFVKNMKELGVWDDAYVVFTSDHGDQLYEHGGWDHGITLYEHELHVPLIVKWPGRIEAKRNIPTTVQLIDVMPTLLDQLGIEPPAGMQGRSLAGLIAGDQDAESVPAFAEDLKDGDEQKAVILDRMKLIVTPAKNTSELFNLKDDPTEQKPLALEENPAYEKLKAALEGWLAENQKLAAERPETETVPVSAEERNRLKALGYTN